MKSKFCFALVFLLLAGTTLPAQQMPRKINIAFFEAGDYTLYGPLREALGDELDRILPPGIAAVFQPYGFRSAHWKRSECKEAASQLASMTGIDVIVAIGPWVVRDLLEARCKLPIVALAQYDPAADSLIDSKGRPIAPNLTLAYDPTKLENDLRMLKQFVSPKTLGVLYFHAKDEGKIFFDKVSEAAAKFDMKAVTAEGYNNVGIFAFFKAYAALEKKVDALYIGNLLGLDANEIGEFLAAVGSNHIPIFAATDQHLVARGALFSTAPIMLEEARFEAGKILRIIQGAKPADLPTILPTSGALVVGEKAAQDAKLEIPDEVFNGANLFEKSPEPSETPLTLYEAIRIAKEQNPAHLAQLEALNGASFDAALAKARYLPHVSLFGSAAYVDHNTVYDHDDKLQNDLYATGVSVDQTLFSLETLREIRLVSKLAARCQLVTDSGTAQLELAVSGAFFNYLRAEEELALQLAHRSRIDQYFEISRARVALGETDSTDSHRWTAERLLATSAITAARAQRREAQIMINILLNRSGSDLLLLERGLFDADAQVWDFERLHPFLQSDRLQTRTENYLIQQAIKSNPSVKMVDCDLDLQKLRLSLNHARYYPTVDLHARYFYRDSLRSTASFTEKRSNFALGATLTLPLFEGNRRRTENNRLMSQMSELEYERDAVRLEEMGRIQGLVSDIRSSGTKLSTLTAARQLANNNLDPVEQQYDCGKMSFTDISTALTALLRTHAEALTARFDYFVSQAKLLKEAGWSLSEHSKTAGDELFAHLSIASAKKK